MDNPTAAPPGLLPQLGALASLLSITWLIFMGDPVFKRADRDVYDQPGAFAAAEQRYGALPAQWMWFSAMVRVEVREPIKRWLDWTTVPLRNTQGFGVYPDGGHSIKVLDIYLDGELRHRSADPEHAWLEPQLRFRKLRPLVFKWMDGKLKRKHRPGIGRFIGARAAGEGASRVDLVVWIGPYPGDELTLHRWAAMSAPRWKLRLVPEGTESTWEAP